MKKTAGFTLVELIVVIAILGILAGIAIPVYSGYIDKAHQAADYQQLDAIKTAAVFAFTEKNNETAVTEIHYTESTTTAKVNGTADSNSVDISAYIPTVGVALETGSSADWYAEATTGEGAHSAGWTINE